MKILNRELKQGKSLFKIAEISANHNGSIVRAKKQLKLPRIRR